MKVLGVKQLEQKRFEFLPIAERFVPVLGKLPRSFVGAIYGYSANGKTEYALQMAKELTRFGKVRWISYEQGHDSDIQEAVIRNRMEEVSGMFDVVDPHADLPAGVTFFDDLVANVKKRNSPWCYFLDSFDYTGFTKEQALSLRKLFPRKAFVWIMHEDPKTKLPDSKIATKVAFDGKFTHRVKDFVAFVEKSRTGALPNNYYVIYEEGARARNPLFFEQNGL